MSSSTSPAMTTNNPGSDQKQDTIDQIQKPKAPDSVPASFLAQPQLLVEDFCKPCARLDFKRIFNLKVQKSNGVVVHSRQRRELPEESPCPLCNFFLATLNREKSTASYIRGYHLRAFSAFRHFGVQTTLQDVPDSTILAVCPSIWSSSTEYNLDPVDMRTYIMSTGSSPTSDKEVPQGRFVSQERLNLDMVREWISFCRANHDGICNLKEGIEITSFKVIDCNSREIIDAPEGCIYVALSYVWGSPSNISSDSCHFDWKLPDSCPEVIEDAMRVVKQLNMRYLWIDRYCIDQEDQAEKHNQIFNMDSIYLNAELTIIAAAGEDCSFGLPGVSGRNRDAQPQIEMGDYYLVSTLDNPRRAIGNSKWSTRAWTYQEGLLSQRRLVFTQQQAYFQCTEMHCLESVSIPWRTIEQNARMPEEMTTHRFFPNQSIARFPADFVGRVDEYIPKSLSFESDILNAISGVLKRFEKRKDPIPHFWGIPIFKDGDIEHHHSLLAFTAGLAWAFKTTARRRDDFPSWSWVGWSDWRGLTFPRLRHTPWGTYFDWKEAAISIWTETVGGDLISWENDSGPPCSTSECSRFIHILGYAGKMRFSRAKASQPGPYTSAARSVGTNMRVLPNRNHNLSEWSLEEPRVQFANGEYEYEILLSGFYDKETYLWDGILLADEGRRATILVVGQENDYYVRIGLVIIRHVSLVVPHVTASKAISFGNTELKRTKFRLG